MVTLAPTPRFIFRLPTELRAQYQELADREHRKLSNLIIHALREWLAGRGRPQP